MDNRPDDQTIVSTSQLQPRQENDRIQTVSIIGAGVMGRGIATATVRAGIPVKICDSNYAVAQDAVEKILRIDAFHSIGAPHFAKVGASPLISVAASESEIADADLIIETVTEDIAVKTAVLSGIQPFLRDETIVASNTSSIEISQLASTIKEPGRVCGLHFCHPVSRRPLVEVVGADTTSSETLSCAHRYAESIGMAPILVRDTPGFLLNRLLVPYLNEALELLLEGIDAEILNRVAIDFGMPMGPLAQIDEFGVDIALAVGRSLYQAFPDRIIPSELLIAMYKAGRMGRKTGGGFYDYRADSDSSQLAPCVAAIIQKRQRSEHNYSMAHVTQRLFLPMLLEATRAVEESLVDDSTIIDIALRDGLGMTQPDGGLLAWAESIGAATILDWLRPMKPLGRRFEPSQLLLDVAGGEVEFNRPPGRTF